MNYTEETACPPVFAPITKSDSALVSFTWLRFDVGGAVKLTTRDGPNTHDVTLNFTDGEYFPGKGVLKVWSTGTDSGVVVHGLK